MTHSIAVRPARACIGLICLSVSLALTGCGGGDGSSSDIASSGGGVATSPGTGPGVGTGTSTTTSPALWPATALSDPAVQGKEPSLPTTVCATLSATLTKNSKGLLDASVDAPPANSEPDTANIQAAINGCPAGQAVKLVKGSQGQNAFLSGPIVLPGSVTLWVDAGVTLFASRKPSDYQISGKNNCGETASSDNGCNALITTTPNGNGVVGDGVIDGRGGEVLTSGLYANKLTWWDVGALTKTMSNASQNNPRLIQVNGGSNFSLYRITLQNAPKFHVVTSGVSGVTAWGTKILTPSLEYSVAGYQCAANTMPVVSGSPNTTTPSTCFTPATVKNTDGIDPGQSQNVLIAFNHISNGDDGIAIKSHASTTGPVSNVQILHNRFYFTHGMSLGSETDSGMNGITIRDLTIDGFDVGASSGIRIKTDDSRGGEVKNVTVDGVCARRLQQPIVMDPYYGDASGSAKALYPNLHDITVRNFRYLDVAGSVYDGANAALLLRGYQSQGQFNYLYNVVFDNVVFDSLPGWATTKLTNPVPSYAELTMGSGPVSFASLLLAGQDINHVHIFDNRAATPAPYDCSAAFVDFPAVNAPMSIH